MSRTDVKEEKTAGSAGGYTILQRVLALLGVAALVILAAAAFVVAVLGGESTLVFRLLIGAVFLPILIWLLLWSTGKTPRRGGETNERD